jgi:uncharacterized protein (DUF2236 family)
MNKRDAQLGWKIDFEAPKGAAAYVGPDSVHWRVFKNPIAMGIGGAAAVLLEFADARIRSGVWDHSVYKTDPIGRSRRTGMAAMVGVYGPKAAAQRVIQGVTRMHARVEGKTPAGESYRALDGELLNWVSATASYGFLNAYDRFVARVSDPDKRRFYAEAVPVAKLYGVEHCPNSDQDFIAMMEHLAPRFEPHPIVNEFLTIFETTSTGIPVPKFLRRAITRAAVSILPPLVREKLGLGHDYDLNPLSARLVRVLGALADRVPIPSAPPAAACRRIGLPQDFLYRSQKTQVRLLEDWAEHQPKPSDAIDVSAQ